MTIATALIYVVPGADPARDRLVHGSTTIVAVSDPDAAVAIAGSLAKEGTGLVELCGGIPPTVRARAMAAAGERARVSSITYGIESLYAAARFKAAYERGETPGEAFILLDPAADEVASRIVATPGLHPTTIVPVADADTAARAATALVEQGVLLIELYGGFSTAAIATVINAVDGRAAVGAGSFAVDALR